ILESYWNNTAGQPFFLDVKNNQVQYPAGFPPLNTPTHPVQLLWVYLEWVVFSACIYFSLIPTYEGHPAFGAKTEEDGPFDWWATKHQESNHQRTTGSGRVTSKLIQLA
ncbi:unnamed protein product, partial [Ectocarpus sp. 12 AP-2014]